MDELVLLKQWLSSAIVVVCVLPVIAGLMTDIPQIAEKWLPPDLRKHPRSWLSIACVLFMAISLHFIWQPADAPPPLLNIAPASKNVAAAESPSIATPELPQVVNRQAQKMARQFSGMLVEVSGERLTDHERKFYAEYLCAVMPAKIEAICGVEDRRQYDRLLAELKEKSEDIQLHFHGLEPFVTNERFINPNTPPAGPVIESPQDAVETQIVAKDSPVEPQTKPSPPATVKLNPLDEYLDRVGWVQCRKCGKVHYMNFLMFSKFGTMDCENCKFKMDFEYFSRQIAAEAERLRQIATPQDAPAPDSPAETDR